jgi:GTP cyclohydrolase IA
VQKRAGKYSKFNYDRVRHHVVNMLDGMGYDVENEHLQDTARRVTDAYKELLVPEPFNFTVFDNEEGYDEIILQTGVRFVSLCAHHLLSFAGRVSVAYIPGSRYVGLSKLARVVDHFSRDLQIQERLTQQIGMFLVEQLEPVGVGVVVTANHSCMGIRGAKQPDAMTTTSFMWGAFRDKPAARQELMTLIQLGEARGKD